jgi:ribulose kinase
LIRGLNIVEGGQTSTGSIVNWFRKLVNEDSYEELNKLAELIAPGCEGLLALDHFQVRRSQAATRLFAFLRVSACSTHDL